MTQPFAGRFREHKQGLYTLAYYEQDVEDAAALASSSIAGSVIRDINPQSVIDIGAGTGALLEKFSQAGIATLGLEYSAAGRGLAAQRGLDVRAFDVRFDTVDSAWGRFGAACCTEVAEHIPAQFARRLVQLLVSLSDAIIFTAATPGQGGVDHVNEQPHEYWIDLFRAEGYAHDAETSARWSAEWKSAKVKHWYWKNVMVFSRNNAG